MTEKQEFSYQFHYFVRNTVKTAYLCCGQQEKYELSCIQVVGTKSDLSRSLVNQIHWYNYG